MNVPTSGSMSPASATFGSGTMKSQGGRGRRGVQTLGAGCDPEPLSERGVPGDAACRPIMAPPSHRNGMAMVVSAIGPCQTSRSTRPSRHTGFGQRDLAVTALVVFPACLLPLHRKVSLSSPPQDHGMCDCSSLVYILTAAGPGHVLKPLSNNAQS